MNPLFDFSGLQVGQKLTRLIFNIWISEASVVTLTDKTIHCSVLEDTLNLSYMAFDRRTGVHVEGSRFGLIVNRAGKGREFLRELKKDILDCLQDGKTLLPETSAALRENLSQDL
jgi:hypothetical protein